MNHTFLVAHAKVLELTTLHRLDQNLSEPTDEVEKLFVQAFNQQRQLREWSFGLACAIHSCRLSFVSRKFLAGAARWP